VGLFVARLQSDEKKEIKSSLLEEALRKATSLAVQMDISEREAMDLFAKIFKEIKSQKERTP
jgi:DNA-binding transcriptional regulator YhcF (GntR family)